jgi:hypothetical protein
VGNLDSNGGYLVPVLGGVALLALVIAGVALAKVRPLSRRFSWASGSDTSGTDTLAGLLRAVDENQRQIAVLTSKMDAAVVEARTHFKRMGIVRYNAFEGVAGQQSYSLCLLDENQNGILISNLVGTNFSRGYAVEIRNGTPQRPLGDEEKEALASASKNGN